MNNIIEYQELLAFHPGSYVEDIKDDMNITQRELASRLDMTEKSLSKLINGEDSLSKEVSRKLSNMTGTSIDLWLNLQNEYEKKRIEIEELKSLDMEKNILNKIDFSYFIKNSLIEKQRETAESKVEKLRKMLKISGLNVLLKPNFLANFRNTTGELEEKSIINSNIMLQLAINEAESIKLNSLNIEKIKSFTKDEIKNMTLQSPNEFYPRLKEVLADCGVAFVVLPHLRNSAINGAVMKIRKDKVLLAINDKNKKSDIFWFTLLHEIGHIINKDFIVDLFDNSSFEKDLEDKADRFAMDSLIDRYDYTEFISQSNGRFSYNNINSFAESVGIHPGIVVGRLQHDKLVSHKCFHSLKKTIEIKIS